MGIMNFGSMNIDYVFSVKHAVQAGETLPVDNLEIFAGGKGLNQSIAAARAGASVSHAGRIGGDGEFLLKLLRDNGIGTENVIFDRESQSGGAYIQVEPSGRNTMLIYGGTNKKLSEEQIDAALRHAPPGGSVMLQNETNLGLYIIRAAKEKGLFVIYNPSPVTPEIFEIPYGLIDLLIVNEDEGAALSGGGYSPEETLERLYKICPNFVILTLGSRGAYGISNGVSMFQPVYPAVAVDSTGAGDTFTGYVAAALDRGESLKDAMDLAAKASAIAVSRMGAAVSIPTIDEVRAAYVDGGNSD